MGGQPTDRRTSVSGLTRVTFYLLLLQHQIVAMVIMRAPTVSASRRSGCVTRRMTAVTTRMKSAAVSSFHCRFRITFVLMVFFFLMNKAKKITTRRCDLDADHSNFKPGIHFRLVGRLRKCADIHGNRTGASALTP